MGKLTIKIERGHLGDGPWGYDVVGIYDEGANEKLYHAGSATEAESWANGYAVAANRFGDADVDIVNTLTGPDRVV